MHSLLQLGQNFFSLSDPADPGKSYLDSIVMFFFGAAGHRVLRENLLIAVFVGKAGSAFNADIGGNSAQDYSFDFSPGGARD